MLSVRDLRRKVKSVKSTQQITKAMKMVSAARLQRAQGRIVSARPFANEMKELLSSLCAQVFAQGQKTYHHPFLASPEGSAGRVGLIVVSADKGLCGSFNTNLLRKSHYFISKHGGQETQIFAVGRKGRDFFRGLKVNVAEEYVGISGRLGFVHAELVGNAAMEAYLKKPLEAAYLIYNEFKSIVQQRVVVEKLLPIDIQSSKGVILSDSEGSQRSNNQEILPLRSTQGQNDTTVLDYLYEPDQKQLLNALLPRFIKSQIYRALLESAAAELAARMTAMDSATRNASELIESLTLTMNKVRQAGITKEISELVTGAEALK